MLTTVTNTPSGSIIFRIPKTPSIGIRKHLNQKGHLVAIEVAFSALRDGEYIACSKIRNRLDGSFSFFVTSFTASGDARTISETSYDTWIDALADFGECSKPEDVTLS